MIHTLEALRSGALYGSKSLSLSCDLKTFPDEIITLADSLEVLDLSGNHLTEIPASIAQLKKLRILFISRNRFTIFPEILKQCASLTMIGFKSNQIHTVPENAFPPKLQWLILTDNKIKKIPKSIGDCGLLQKCGLAGNLIEYLPQEMAHCKNLELLRISANQLKSIPNWLFELPRLSWVAFAGNPATHQIQLSSDLASFDWSEFTVKELLGEGASGFISKADWKSKNTEVALKIFKGAVTTDGLPKDEMDVSIAAGQHSNLIQVLGRINNHPEQKNGLIMKLISPDYINLGNPPSLKTCTRDVFDGDRKFSSKDLLKIAKDMASVCAQLHSKGINHGDLYAHNILINVQADCLLGDFGASTFYDKKSPLAHNIERVEVRAYGCLLEDILSLVDVAKLDGQLRIEWLKLIAACILEDVEVRPSFNEILEHLERF